MSTNPPIPNVGKAYKYHYNSHKFRHQRTSWWPKDKIWPEIYIKRALYLYIHPSVLTLSLLLKFIGSMSIWLRGSLFPEAVTTSCALVCVYLHKCASPYSMEMSSQVGSYNGGGCNRIDKVVLPRVHILVNRMINRKFNWRDLEFLTCSWAKKGWSFELLRSRTMIF